MGRLFKHLKLTRDACAGLRESVRPGASPLAAQFCEQLYSLYYQLDQDPDLETVDFAATVNTVMVINHHVSAADGKWANDVLHQTRQVWYELWSGKPAVKLAPGSEAKQLFEPIIVEPEPKAAEDV